MSLASMACVLADTNVSNYWFSLPDHYDDCNECKYKPNKNLKSLPFDIQVTDSVWFRTNSNIFLDGFTAYLYSDCDVNFDVYYNCTSFEPIKSVVIPKNQARDVTSESLKQKLEDMGVDVDKTSVNLFVCIYPVGGSGGRLMCYPYNAGYNSTCDDILSLLPGMTFVSSHANDVYEITADNIADSYTMYLQCDVDCQLAITRGSCDGETIAEYDFTAEDGLFHFDSELLMDVRATGESLYAHISHDESVVGRISLNEVKFVENLIDTVVCQGKEFRYEDFVTTESGVYVYDTVQVSEIKYKVYGYNIIFAEPEVEYDTIALKRSELPYLYREQYTIGVDGFGDYDVMIYNEGDCDEHVLLHVEHKFATIVSDQDTTLCKGKRFKYEGKNYVNDVTFVDSVWDNTLDTLYLNRLNVYFAPNDVVYDTLALTKAEVSNYKYQGITINSFGDYSVVVYDEQYCSDTLYLHVCHKIITEEQVVDTTLCAGDVYKHTDGTEYTTSVVLRDSVWADDDTRVITTTNVEFIAIDLAYDTLYLRYAELPYLYENQVEITQIADTMVSILYGQCSGDVQLHVVHKIDTVVVENDTTLCQGKMYDHNGVLYSESATIVDSMWTNQDTFVITTTRVYFAAPEVQYDTLEIRATELPYVYRGEQIDGFGQHDLMIKSSGECDEHVMLYVQQLVTTVTAEQDTTLCQGKVYSYNGELYSEPATIVDSVWVGQDTLFVATTRVYFAAPEVQYDTLEIRAAELPYVYRGEQIDGFGQHDLMIKSSGECDEHVMLYVRHLVTTVTAEQDTTLCQGKVYSHNGELYSEPATIVDSVWVGQDTLFVATTRVYFAVPEVQYDTLEIRAAELPYVYRGEQIDGFGQHDLMIKSSGECDEHVMLYVQHLVTTVTAEQDTTLCQGKVYSHNGELYSEPATIVDSVWVGQDTLLVATVNVEFTAPEVEYDTIYVSEADLKNGYYYELADAYIYVAGEYNYEITADDECTRIIALVVIEKIPSSLDNVMVVDKPKLIMIEGVIYIFHNGEYYTLMGERVGMRN